MHALKMVNLGYWYWVPSKNELVWSRESYYLAGYDPDIDTNPSVEMFMQNIHPDDQERVQIALQKTMQEGVAPDLEYRFVHPNKTITVLARAELIRGNGDKPDYLFGTLQDITLQKEQHTLLEKANRAKSEFLSNITHELRTPLNAILGFTQILEWEVQSASQKESVNEIINAGTELISLIDDVLELAELESSGFHLVMQPLSLKKIIEECVALLVPAAEKMSVTVITHIDHLDRYVFNSDPTRIKQIVLNLLSNAIKFNRPSGTVALSVSQKDDEIELVVEDTGVGIAVEQQKDVFTPFNRMGHEGGNIAGAGVGLAIIRRIVDAMSGSIQFNSVVGQGSRFWVRLPGHLEYQPTNQAPQNAQGDLNAQKVVSLLYVEDNPSNLKLIDMAFANDPSVKIELASTPGLGLDLLQHHHFDIIMLDINLPQMSGYDLLDIIKNDPALKDVPVIAVTSNAMPDDIVQGKEAGFSDYFTKPIDLQRLKSYVSSVTVNKDVPE